jgi:subtilisin family serine protease
MGKLQINKEFPCTLPPIEREDVFLLSDGQRYAWSITAFDLPQAWKVAQGEGVKIAVLDTGCDLSHPDLVANLLPGVNFVQPGRPPEDDNQHGTHVIGIICALNNEIGVVGVAPKAKVMPIKILDKNGSGNFDNVARGIKWAVENGADIISMSLGSPMPLPKVQMAVQWANSQGVPVFCAAGNCGQTKELLYPANYPDTISIGSIDENFNRSGFSNTGQNLDFLAPGGKIFSTVPKNWYALLSGTSMACPFAVGVAALLLSYKKTNNLKIKLNSAQDYRNLFKEHTIPVSDSNFAGKKFFQGFGIIDPREFYKWWLGTS